MPRAITGPRFRSLPKSDQAAILGAIAALNSVTPYKGERAASTAREVDHVAFDHIADQHAPLESDHLRATIKANATALTDCSAERREQLIALHRWDAEAVAMHSWSAERLASAEGAAVIQRSYDSNYIAQLVWLGGVLESLIKNKRILVRGGHFPEIAAQFNLNTAFEPHRVVLDKKGYAEIFVRAKFRNALGLVAWAIIQLSQLRAHGHVILRCRECGAFKIVSVSKQQHFCSPAHRNLYNVHAHRERQRAAATRHK